jgi:hypothetical protein
MFAGGHLDSSNYPTATPGVFALHHTPHFAATHQGNNDHQRLLHDDSQGLAKHGIDRVDRPSNEGSLEPNYSVGKRYF